MPSNSFALVEEPFMETRQSSGTCSIISGRTVEQVNEIITLAKMEKKDLQPVSQEILFSPDFSTKEYRLLQLNKDVLESIEIGDTIVFRGGDSDSAVLCTNTKTYEVKEAETSNSLLLFQDLKFGAENSFNLNNSLQDHSVVSRQILEVSHSYLEIKHIRPYLSKIRHILLGTEYDGSTEKYDEGQWITLGRLLEQVPASINEVKNYIDDNMVLEIEGKLQLVEDDYLFRIFSQILNCIDGNSWKPDKICKHTVVKSLESLAKPFFIEKIFQWFFIPVEIAAGSSSGSISVSYTFHEEKVCRFLGETLLKSMGKFNMKEFLTVWQESVPEGLTVSLEQLNGVCVFDEECTPSLIWYFPEYNLPDSFSDRLSVLFETKKRWKRDEIMPFIEVFAPPSQTVDNLLTKFARCSNVNGTKFYSSKHGK